ncbi:ribokinase [Propionivibrio dicarboxylicus]|uniref:Ribokinase n=1 Tax=Propionivibrio dicarboxylicus TaxID=83767 RepID=A0A1G7XTD7_9RHOO|nr:ribokinase [Propionivibrio dicarboxylicus]SDG87437.1 ribokinase [Propionivibrio dicarboxylicus]
MARVLVIGSINMDLVVNAARFPGPGETVLGQSFSTFPGGKGANQAVAAKRLGADVTMIGCVGDDAFGTQLTEQLANEGIDTRFVRRVPGVSTGVATITLSGAENSIVVVPGANHALTEAQLDAAEAAFADADVVLCQLEIPLAIVDVVARKAAAHGKPFLLNPAPAVVLSDELLDRVTLMTPNEHELALVYAGDCGDWQATLRSRPQRILMTHGAEGAWFADADGQLRHQPAFPVEAVDTTGAGDTFNGAIAAFWGLPMAEIARLACAAGALSVTRSGAQSGMPTRAQLESFLFERS